MDSDYSVPARGITFAPNVDAETYGAPPPLIEPPPSTLFPASDDEPSPRRASHARKKPDDWIPRPPNAFILFRSEFIKSQHVPGDVEANHGNLSKIIGLCWRNLPFPERSVWEHKARLAQAAHKAQYPHYRFRPHTKPADAGPRRRVKEPPAPPDARRVAHIAGLLVDGVKGARLARAVRQLDQARAPRPATVTMRFDEPVTAAQYAAQRPGSAPLEEGETAPAPRRVRAKSSSPAKKRRATKETTMATMTTPPPVVAPEAVWAWPQQQQGQDQQQQWEAAWSPTAEEAAWSPADDTGTWSPAEDNGTWSPAEDNGTWSPAEDNGTWSPVEDNGTWSPAEDNGTWSPAPAPSPDAPAPAPHPPYSPTTYPHPYTHPNPHAFQYALDPALFPPPPPLDLDTALSASPVDTPQRSPTLAYYPAPALEPGCGVEVGGVAEFGIGGLEMFAPRAVTVGFAGYECFEF